MKMLHHEIVMKSIIELCMKFIIHEKPMNLYFMGLEIHEKPMNLSWIVFHGIFIGFKPPYIHAHRSSGQLGLGAAFQLGFLSNF